MEALFIAVFALLFLSWLARVLAKNLGGRQAAIFLSGPRERCNVRASLTTTLADEGKHHG